ncbi:MAG TPA: alpha/beta fold hydrolase [Bryobacteraceae bacterium]|nr:alpha/beta fold hydrolase [Bryobacteraceae bacterium]
MPRTPLVCFVVFCALAQAASPTSARFTIEQALSSAFPTHLVAAPAGGRVAWVSNARGVINIMVAGPPDFRARPVTQYRNDDGQDITELRWTPDASSLVYVRGEGPNRAGEIPNPALDPKGAEQEIWVVGLEGGGARKLGDGSSIAISPRGDRIAYVRKGQVWWASLDGSHAPEQAFVTRGELESPVWSPDGARLAFVSQRGDHSFAGVYDISARRLVYLDPSTDFDSDPVWSPDAQSVAFRREPSHGKGRIYGARRSDEPWSIRIADALTGAGRQLWKADAGPGSVYRGVNADSQLLWAADGRLVFPWERDGWTHLYSIPVNGGFPTLLTPGDFEVEDVALAPGGKEVLFNSNQGDTDRRHLWRVSASGGTPEALTTGSGIEWSPAMTSDGHVAFLGSDAQHPAHPVLLKGKAIHELDPAAIPVDFPLQNLVTPQAVTFTAADGLLIHAQLFLPPDRNGSRSPAVVFFHGGPRRQMLLGWNYRSYYHNAYAMNQYLANSGYVVLSVNFRGGIGYGLNFREAPQYGATGASEFQDVEAAGRYLQQRPDVDPARIGVWGGSYGGYLTAMALARLPEVFRAGVDLHGVHDWAVEYDLAPTDPLAKTAFDSSPLAFVNSWRAPVLLIQGDDDRNVKFNQTVLLADALRQRNVPMEELIFPDEVHEFLLWRHWCEAYEAAARFFEKYLSVAGTAR